MADGRDGDIFADTAADLAESANVEEADCCDLGNMLFHRQFRIEQNAKIAHDVGRIDRSTRTDGQ